MPQVLSPIEPAAASHRPLCVDLDGTLVKSDTLVDSLLVLARRQPALLLGLVRPLLQGKAAFKAYVSTHITLDVAHLPYNRKLIEYLREERMRGRNLYLATGANESIATRVAAHLGFFTGVLGSDESTNLTGARKLDRLHAYLHSEQFDYVGNDTPDLPLLAHATEPMVADPSRRLRIKMRAQRLQPVRVFEERNPTFLSVLKAVRPHQWSKNLLIFLPLLFSHSVHSSGLIAAFIAFCCFSLTASSAYILNDLLDIEADRRHPKKRDRPFAAGDLSAVYGFVLIAIFLLIAFTGARLLPIGFYGWLGVYLIATMAYSWYLKRVEIVDTLMLSGLYTLRLLAGGAATSTRISHWLAGFSIFLFFSLAMVKRFAELENLRASGASPRNGRGYIVADLNQLRTFGTASAFAAVMVFAIYISGTDVAVLYRQPDRLWLIVPLMILWLCRVWLLASRGELNEDPLVFALTDKMSLCIGAAIAIIVLIAI